MTILWVSRSNSPWELVRNTKIENPTRNTDAQEENAMTEEMNYLLNS